MIGALLTLVIYILILGLLYWLFDYLLGVVPLPDPLGSIGRRDFDSRSGFDFDQCAFERVGRRRLGLPFFRWWRG